MNAKNHVEKGERFHYERVDDYKIALPLFFLKSINYTVEDDGSSSLVFFLCVSLTLYFYLRFSMSLSVYISLGFLLLINL